MSLVLVRRYGHAVVCLVVTCVEAFLRIPGFRAVITAVRKFVHHIAVMAVCISSAFFMILLVAMPFMNPVIYPVRADADNHGNYEE